MSSRFNELYSGEPSDAADQLEDEEASEHADCFYCQGAGVRVNGLECFACGGSGSADNQSGEYK